MFPTRAIVKMRAVWPMAVAAWVAVVAAPGTVFAQWPSYPAKAEPRGPDGKVDMNAPAPRTPDGHPDLSGIWDFRNTIGIEGDNAKAVDFTDTGTGLGPRQAFNPRLSQFFNIGSTLKGGLPFRPLAAEVRARRAAENNKDNPDAHCLPLGLMQLHTHPQPRKIIQMPEETVILYEAQAGIRQIFTDGRPLPPRDAQPWWYGYSVGHWEGETLVVETTGFRDDVWLDVEGSPLTNAGKMTERFHRFNYGHLEIDVTVDDPSAYTKPWTVKIRQVLMPDTELIEFICNENDRSGPHLVGK
ncbi:MAG TPA: hypothetical protein VKV17_07800 [Bryobacteraceae bacterium]|nr:hypothetical protein [Bryobacteraceae bacterium]